MQRAKFVNPKPMHVFAHTSVEDDLTQFATHYETQHRGLGLEFLADVETSKQILCEFPLVWKPIVENIRRLRLGTFKRHAIWYCYFEEREELMVLSITHSPQSTEVE